MLEATSSEEINLWHKVSGELTGLVSWVAAITKPEHNVSIEQCVRCSDWEPLGKDSTRSVLSFNFTALPWEKDADNLIAIFNEVGIVHQVGARDQRYVFEKERPHQPVALIQLDIRQENIEEKIRKGKIVAGAWIQAAVLKESRGSLQPEDLQLFNEQLAARLG